MDRFVARAAYLRSRISATAASHYSPRPLLMLAHSSIIICITAIFGAFVDGQSTLSPPGQPIKSGKSGQFEIITQSLVSAQQLFLGTLNTAYFIDKAEGNPTQVNGHPAWASELTLDSGAQRALDIKTNTFCAGGGVLGNGTWVSVGGNQAITPGGGPAPDQNGVPPYNDADGRQSIRLLNPCDDGTCNWVISAQMTDQRWYPTLETLEDGTLIIIGGCTNGGFVNDPGQDNPTYEFYPSRGAPIALDMLHRTLPVNLYPLTWLLPSGKLLMQSNRETILFDYKNNKETPLDNMPDAVRVYPASAGTIMLPLTPANQWTATILFCGGSNVADNEWYDQNFVPIARPASASCVRLTPDASGTYTEDDPLPEERSMGSLIALPNGKILCLNGAQMGTAGYGTNGWAVGHSFADRPALTPVVYDSNAPAGQRWSRDGLQPSTVPRMYHSSAILLPDGSVLVSGSNPNEDYTVGQGIEYPTEYRTERFYPSYYSQRRPQPVGIPSQLSYGGPSFNITLGSDDLFGNVQNLESATVNIIRTGFSTHAMNMGQRIVELGTTYTGSTSDNTGILHVQQLPPNPAILAPGPALFFVVVNGVPSVGVQVMIGSGQIGDQQVQATANLPTSAFVQSFGSSSTKESSGSTSDKYGYIIIFVEFTHFVTTHVHVSNKPLCLYTKTPSDMQLGYRPNYHRTYSRLATTSNDDRTPTVTGPQSSRSIPKGTMHVKRVTLTSKKNWWMVEMDEEENLQPSSFEETIIEPAYSHGHGTDQMYHPPDRKAPETPPPSPIYNPPRQPASLFSFPTPAAYCAPPNPTASLLPYGNQRRAANECIGCDGAISGRAQGVHNSGTSQEHLRVSRVARERGDGARVDYHNQLLDGLTHLHSYRLSHGDLSLLNIQVTTRSNTIKLLDFGRSVCADSEFVPPHEEPVDPFEQMSRKGAEESRFKGRRVEQIHPGTRPFSAPEILRGECTDPLLADAYSFGMILVCVDRCESVDVKPWEQRRDVLPGDLYDGCMVFRERAGEYLRRVDGGRRRLVKEDMVIP
ncbi:hypothetical protein APHAL10511_000178 [Amanita phalloides]|nr:hypothetical protein APHAL10511_000178 [Amanita phalloides]